MHVMHPSWPIVMQVTSSKTSKIQHAEQAKACVQLCPLPLAGPDGSSSVWVWQTLCCCHSLFELYRL